MTGILNLLMGTVRSAVVTDPYFEYTTLLLPGSGTNGAQNNTFLDGSTNNFTITRNGNTTQGTFSPFSQTGWGNYFDGTTDNLKVSNNAAFQFGTTAFTIEFWVYLTTTSGSPQFICCYQNSSTGYNIALNASAVLTCNLSGDGSDITGTTTVQANQWNHIALSGTGGTSVKLFLNGVQEGSTFTGATSLSPGTYPFTIGSFAGGGFGDANFITGYMSNVRVVKGTAVYTGNFTPPSLAPLTTAGSTSAASYPSTTNVNTSFASSETSLLTCQSNRFRDASTNNFTITVNGDTRVVAFSPFNPTASWSAATYGGSGYFDGSADYLTTPNVAALQLSNSVAWTIELWFYANAMSGQQHIFHGYNTASPYQGWGIALGANTQPATTLLFWDGTTWRNIASGLSPGQWYHVAVAYDGSGTTGRLYLNGNQQGSSFAPASTINNTSTAIGIGGQYDGSLVFNGYANGARIVKGTAVYTGSTYPVPTAPLTAITNTSLLLNFTNAGIYDATSKNDLETVGNAQISTTQSKWGGSSMYFDGTGDYLVGPSNSLFNFGSSDFTMEGWFNQTGLSNSFPGFLSNPITFSAGAWAVLGSHASSGVRKLQFYCYNYSSTAPLLLGTTTLSDNTWYYFAVTRSGSTFRLFLNGTIEATTTFAGSMTSADNGIAIGTNQVTSGYPFQGYLQDIRVTRGYARYTANFTAPTAAFPTL